MSGPGRGSDAVLVCGADEILLRCRGRVLERAGLEVQTAVTLAQAAEWFGRKEFSLVVLCHTLSGRTRRALQLLCWRARAPIYEIPVLMPPEQLLREVAGRTMRREPAASG